MTEITPEEIAEFWQWCGWKLTNLWVYGDNEHAATKLPELTLGNLFLYAVPHIRYYNYRLESIKFIPDSGEWMVDMTLEQIDDRYSPECKAIFSRGNDPAIALFRAIQQVMKEERNGSL